MGGRVAESDGGTNSPLFWMVCLFGCVYQSLLNWHQCYLNMSALAVKGFSHINLFWLTALLPTLFLAYWFPVYEAAHSILSLETSALINEQFDIECTLIEKTEMQLLMENREYFQYVFPFFILPSQSNCQIFIHVFIDRLVVNTSYTAFVWIRRDRHSHMLMLESLASVSI